MSAENIRGREQFSGAEFLAGVESAWGGRLFFAVTPGMEEATSRLRLPPRNVFAVIASGSAAAPADVNSLPLSGNPVEDFKACATLAMPHPDEVRDYIHLLADPFCRAQLAEQLEWFMRPSLPELPKGMFATASTLPFELEGPDSIALQTRFFLPSVRHYFDAAKRKAGILAQQLDVPDADRERFVGEFERGMDRIATMTERVISGDELVDEPPIVKTVSYLAAAQFLFKT